MSVSYWLIEGVGLNADNIEPYINKENTVRFFCEQFPDEAELIDIILQIARDDKTFDDLTQWIYQHEKK